MPTDPKENSSPYTDYQPDPKWRFRMRITALIIFGTWFLWFVCGFLKEEKDFWTVFIGGMLTLFVIVATCFQAHISNKQWRVMQKQLTVMSDQYIANIMPAVVTMEARLKEPISSREPPVADIYYFNSGNGIANDVGLSYGFAIPKGKLREQMRNGILPKTPTEVGSTRAVLAPNAPPKHFTTKYLAYGDGMLDEMLNGERTFFVYGEIRFADLIGNGFILEFCFAANDINSTSLSYVSRHNRIIPVASPETSENNA